MIDTGFVANFISFPLQYAKQWNLRLDKYFSKDRIYGNLIRNPITPVALRSACVCDR